MFLKEEFQTSIRLIEKTQILLQLYFSSHDLHKNVMLINT